MKLLILLLLACITHAVSTQSTQEWDASNYPNPTADGYVRCNMKSPSSVCDPDAVFTESERYRLNYELNQLESRTRQINGDNFCSKKGIVGAIGVARHVRGGTENAVKAMANDMLRRWTLDKQCSKSLVIVLSTDDKKFWVARDSRVPVYAAEFTDLFTAQKSLFKEGKYQEALLNVLEGTWDKALAKQGPAPSDDGSSRGPAFQPGGSKREPSSGSPFSIFGKIPMSVWLLLLLIIIPLLCCCCCMYFCCCRSRGNNRRQVPPADEENGRNVGDRGNVGRGGSGGNRFGGFNGILSGIGGGMAGNAIGNFFRSRGQPGGGNYAPGGGNYVPGGYEPGLPREPKGTSGGGRGLYPSVEVKDEGGGGSW